jgi:hypothetical protein
MTSPKTVLAVDPGKRHAGWAYFSHGLLQSCGLVEGEDPLAVAAAIRGVSHMLPHVPVEVLCVEGQQVYGGRIRTDPNDLIHLAQTVGGIRALVPHRTWMNPKPAQWKGSVPKDIFTARIEAKLTPADAAVLNRVKLTKKFRVDVLDAIGLGCWALSQT